MKKNVWRLILVMCGVFFQVSAYAAEAQERNVFKMTESEVVEYVKKKPEECAKNYLKLGWNAYTSMARAVQDNFKVAEVVAKTGKVDARVKDLIAKRDKNKADALRFQKMFNAINDVLYSDPVMNTYQTAVKEYSIWQLVAHHNSMQQINVSRNEAQKVIADVFMGTTMAKNTEATRRSFIHDKKWRDGLRGDQAEILYKSLLITNDDVDDPPSFLQFMIDGLPFLEYNIWNSGR